MAQISDLPSELVEQILSYLTQPSLYALSCVSRSLYVISIPYLYSDVDLLIPDPQLVPRVDRILFNILEKPYLAGHVKSLQVGVAPGVAVAYRRRCFPKDGGDQHQINYEKAMAFVDRMPLIPDRSDMEEPIFANDYGAYSALLLLALPSVQRVTLTDDSSESIRPIRDILSRLDAEEFLNRLQGTSYFTSIKEVAINVDKTSGTRCHPRSPNTVWQALGLPNIERLEFTVLTNDWSELFSRRRRLGFGANINYTFRTTAITSIVIRHTRHLSGSLRGVIQGTPQLRSLTCEMYCDLSESEVQALPNAFNRSWIALIDLNTDLTTAKYTLETLVLSVELCHGNNRFFQQPDIRKYFNGHLDLRGFVRLHTLEVPVPFLTGDPTFWDSECLLPESLRHLTLRTDMSRAQFPYPWDTSTLPAGLSYTESLEEKTHLDGARMDMSLIYRIALDLVDQHHHHLESMALWQPPDPSLEIFGDQLRDFAVSCRNKGMTAKAIYPLLMRWREARHWDLVREVTLFDRYHPAGEKFGRLFRGDRQGIPLGLATQYHLIEIKQGRVRKRR